MATSFICGIFLLVSVVYSLRIGYPIPKISFPTKLINFIPWKFSQKKGIKEVDKLVNDLKIELTTPKLLSVLKSSGHMSRRSSRVLQELKTFHADPPPGCHISMNSDLKSWIVTIDGANQTIYEGESFRLKFIFPQDYPMKPPIVYFIKPIPRHEHVYSNGDICLNLIGKDWHPTMTAQGIAVSILSMLSSAKEKKTPPDNAMHSNNSPGSQHENWLYHDERC